MFYVPTSDQIPTVPELVLTVGISGCGKTTFVRNNFPHHINLNLDDIREELGDVNDQRLTRGAVKIMDLRLQSAVGNRENIVISNTNLNLQYLNRYIEMAGGYKVLILCFDDSYDLNLCASRVQDDIARGVYRSNTPRQVINNMAGKYVEVVEALDSMDQNDMFRVVHV